MTGGAASDPEVMKKEKADLRAAVLARRDAVTSTFREQASRTITQKLQALPVYTSARTVAAYASFGSEFDTRAFLDAVLSDGKHLLLPRIVKEQRVLELREVTDLEHDLVPGVWGIREPDARSPRHDANEVDFMLVPGVAFTTAGARLGYGGGFYDRLLALLRPGVPRVAGTFQLQIVDGLPESPHDQRVTMVVTEA